MTTAQDVIDTASAMKTERARFEPVWKDIAERLDPWGPGQTGDMSKIFGSRPLQLPEQFAAVYASLMMPRSSFWHGLAPLDEELKDRGDVKRHAGKMTKLLFRYRYASGSGFASLPRRMGRSLALYGGWVIMVREETTVDPNGRALPPLAYEFIPLHQICVAKNHRGIYDRAVREYEMTARQMAQKFGKAALPSEIQDKLNRDKDKESQYHVVHLVQPASGKDKAFESIYVERDSKKILKRSGYYEFPYIVSVMNEIEGSAYGYGPAMTSLPDVKQYYAMARTTTRAMEKAVDPPMGLRGKLERRISLNAGSLNPEMLDEQGRPKFAPMQSGAQPVLGLEGMELKSREIGASFSENLWQILVDKPNMTAYEAALRAQEKGDMIGPPFAGQEEAIGLMIQREIAILERQAEFGEINLPEKPEILRDQTMVLEPSSPMSRLRKAAETSGLYRAMEFVQAAGQMDPNVTKLIDWEQAARQVAENEGVPPELLIPIEELAKVRESSAEAEVQEEEMLQQAQAAENANKIAPLMKVINDVRS